MQMLTFSHMAKWLSDTVRRPEVGGGVELEVDDKKGKGERKNRSLAFRNPIVSSEPTLRL